MLLTMLLLAASPAVAATQPSTAPAKAEKKVCKRFGPSDSRMGSKRVCKTAAEWKLMVTNDERVEVKQSRSGRSD